MTHSRLCIHPFAWRRLITKKPAGSHTVEVSVMEVYNNEVFDLLARDERGATGGQRREVITTSSGTIQVTSLTQEWVQSELSVHKLGTYVESSIINTLYNISLAL